MDKGTEVKYIVRIINKDLDGNLPVYRALTGIKGISHRFGKMIALQFEKQTGVKHDMKMGIVPEDKYKDLENIIMHPENAGIPVWALNRRKDFESGKNWHAVLSDLDLEHRKDVQRMSMIKSYRGLRLMWGLTVRGQRTKSTHRGKGPVVGVTKKDAKAAAAPAKAAAGKDTALKKEEKKK